MGTDDKRMGGRGGNGPLQEDADTQGKIHVVSCINNVVDMWK
jgi:hypothetical protein